MNPAVYENRQECIEYEILQPLGTHFAAFDVDAIADELVEMVLMGLHRPVMFQLDYTKDFWATVQKHELKGEPNA